MLIFYCSLRAFDPNLGAAAKPTVIRDSAEQSDNGPSNSPEVPSSGEEDNVPGFAHCYFKLHRIYLSIFLPSF